MRDLEKSKLSQEYSQINFGTKHFWRDGNSSYLPLVSTLFHIHLRLLDGEDTNFGAIIGKVKSYYTREIPSIKY